MDLNFSASEQELRDEIRDWLDNNIPAEDRPHDRSGLREYDLAWQRAQYDGGWAGISWPTEYGGRGLSLVEQLIWHEEYARAGAPDVGVCFVGLNHGGPTVIVRGSEEQKADRLPKVLRGESVWCQGFSEPGSGSDLASLQTRGDVDGDHVVVNGQKVWTTYADVSDTMELLVRTDRTAARHAGISWVILDMNTPGVDVRPLRTMTRDPHFSEVFFDDVRIPLGNVVGEINSGWSVAMATLGFERGTALMSRQVALSRTVRMLVQEAGERKRRGAGSYLDDVEIRRALADVAAEVVALEAMTYATVSRAARSDVPGPEGSMVKLYFTEVTQRVLRLAMSILGHDALHFTPPESRPGAWTGEYLKSFSSTIAGGTSEIQKNIIGERVLGLPR